MLIYACLSVRLHYVRVCVCERARLFELYNILFTRKTYEII